MTKSQRLKMIKRIAKKVDRERTVSAKLAKKELDAFDKKNMYLSDKEVYNTLEGSGIMDTYSAMKGYDSWQ